MYKCSEESDVGDAEVGIIEDVVRDDERVELLMALVEEEEYNGMHRRRRVFEPQFQNNDIFVSLTLFLLCFNASRPFRFQNEQVVTSL